MATPSSSLHERKPQTEIDPTLRQTIYHLNRQANAQEDELQVLKQQHDASAAALHKLVAEANATAVGLSQVSLRVAYQALVKIDSTPRERWEAGQEGKKLARLAEHMRESCNAAAGSLGMFASEYAEEDLYPASSTSAEGQAKRGAPPRSSEAAEEQPPQKK
ncbi:unnamed protein product [Zymoseptoria tritici ST99CH_1E4]|uniref:Uncharacterized protein n=1 Tax=Zymoseptoria tritici ST99CH_1E4 TaxID=1276532 RepID=A0A2H1GFK4_ZYMTR|nr:unnamed protein product [Zymoseptoria tritici ST99CH_1E4]